MRNGKVIIIIMMVLIFLFGLAWLWTGLSFLFNTLVLGAQTGSRKSQLLFSVLMAVMGILWISIAWL